MYSILMVPKNLLDDLQQDCDDVGIQTTVYNIDKTGDVELEVNDRDFYIVSSTLEIMKRKKIPGYKQRMWFKKLRECWPKHRSTKAPKIIYFVHNVTEWICVSSFTKRDPFIKKESWLFRHASRIEFLTRNIITDYRTR